MLVTCRDLKSERTLLIADENAGPFQRCHRRSGRLSCITEFAGPGNGDGLGDLRIDFGFGIGCLSFSIQSRESGTKFPKNFETTEFF